MSARSPTYLNCCLWFAPRACGPTGLTSHQPTHPPTSNCRLCSEERRLFQEEWLVDQQVHSMAANLAANLAAELAASLAVDGGWPA